MASAPPPSFATLPSKPTVRLAYGLQHVLAGEERRFGRMIVFVNNLLMPASSWQPSLELLSNRGGSGRIATLTYDRFGQGETTDRDPLDQRPEAEPGYGHDFADVVKDLHELIALVAERERPGSDAGETQLLLVGASIGGPLARLYAQTYPGTVAGMVILDSNICNANYSDFWPDPKAPGFDPDAVTAPDCTIEQYIQSAEKLSSIYDLKVKNKESLDRRNTPQLLPDSDAPLLQGPGKRTTKLCVVGHDPETFEEQGLLKLAVPKSFTRRYVQTAWDKYNRGLLHVGDTSEFPHVITAKGCDHFIQRDDPQVVADAVRDMCIALGWMSA